MKVIKLLEIGLCMNAHTEPENTVSHIYIYRTSRWS